MQQFLIFVRKEFAHVLRDRRTLLILFGLPIVQIIIFGFALSNEVKNSKILIVDHAKDDVSREIISKMAASKYFDLQNDSQSHEDIERSFKQGNIKLALVFPA